MHTCRSETSLLTPELRSRKRRRRRLRRQPTQDGSKGSTILPRRRVRVGSHWQEDRACGPAQGTPSRKSSDGVDGKEGGCQVRTATLQRVTPSLSHVLP